MNSFSVVLVATLFINLVIYVYGGKPLVISEDEDLDLEQQLNIINKHALKTIETEYGDLIDCVDIYNQPAFDHPLLKNHKFQRRATSPPKVVKKEVPSLAKPVELSKSYGCPSGSVPIRRTTNADLIRHKLLNVANYNVSPQTADRPNSHFSYVSLTEQESNIFHGAKANIDAYNPTVEYGQSSGAQIWIEAGPTDQVNSIQVGWVVDPTLYGDKRTRLVTYWTADGYKKTGCYNILCPGFVQVDKSVTLGEALSNTSKLDGDQYYMMAHVYQDNKTGNWWFVFTDDNVHVGYWPKELFPHLGGGATRIVYGGRAQANVNQLSPPMGSGLFPDGSYYHSCFFEHVQYVGLSNQLFFPTSAQKFNDKPACYGLDNHGLDGDQGYVIFFGGPGGNCGT